MGRARLAPPQRQVHAHGPILRRGCRRRRTAQSADVSPRRHRRAGASHAPHLAFTRVLRQRQERRRRCDAHDSDDGDAGGQRGDQRDGRRREQDGSSGARRFLPTGRRGRPARHGHAALSGGRADLVAPRRLRRVRLPGWPANRSGRRAEGGHEPDAEEGRRRTSGPDGQAGVQAVRVRVEGGLRVDRAGRRDEPDDEADRAGPVRHAESLPAQRIGVIGAVLERAARVGEGREVRSGSHGRGSQRRRYPAHPREAAHVLGRAPGVRRVPAAVTPELDPLRAHGAGLRDGRGTEAIARVSG